MFSQPRTLSLFLTMLLVIAGCSQEDADQTAQDYLQRSQAYVDQGQYRAAMIEASNAIAAAPDDVRYKVALADIYITLGAGRRASDVLQGAAESHPQEVSLPLAEAYLLQGKFLSAQETLERFEPQTPEEQRKKALYLADATRIKGDLEAALEAYRTLVQRYPEDPEIKRHLAENHIFMDQPDQAQALVDDLLARNPEDSRALQLDAILALRKNDLEHAEKQLTSALIDLPDGDMMLPDRAAVLQLLAQTLTSLGRSTEALVYQRLLAEGTSEVMDAQQRLSDAVGAAEQGDLDEAERLLQELLEENPDSHSTAVTLGVVNLRQGDIESAESLLSRSLDVETAGTDVIRATVMAQAETGNTGQALKTLKRALKARPDEPVLQSIHGLLALSVPGHQEEGYLSVQKALAQDPSRGRLRLALARYHKGRNEPEQAMAQLRSAFEYQPADWVVTNAYMNELFTRGNLEEVGTAVAELKKAAPEAPETALFEAQHLFRNDDRAAGIQTLQGLLRAEPRFARGYGVLAQMLMEEGQPEEALDTLEELLALEPENERALRAGIEIISGSDGDQTPEQWLESMAQQYAEARPNATGLRAMVLRGKGDLKAAASLLGNYEGEETDGIRQSRALLYRDQALARARAGDTDEARALLLQALEIFPNSKALNLELVKLEVNAQRYQEAKILLEDLRNRYPDDAQLTLVEARILSREQGPKAAYQRLRQVWAEQPNSQLAPTLLGLAESEDPEAVSGLLAEWRRLAPDGRERLLYMAERQQKEGDAQAAIQLYEGLLARDGNDVVVLNNLAWLLKDSELDRAIDLAERAARQQPGSAAILDTYGWLLHLQGDHEQALSYLEKAAQLAPGADDIQHNLNAVKGALRTSEG